MTDRIDVTSAPLELLAKTDITAPAFKADPFPFYARLRTEAPVFRVAAARGREAWLVTRYDDVLRVLKDERCFVKDPANAMSPTQLRQTPRLPRMFRALERSLLTVDGADHDRLKALVHKAFTPRFVEGIRQSAQVATDAALDRALALGRIDLVADLALPVPLLIIGRILGVPEADHARFGRWWRTFMSIGSGGNPLFAVPVMLRFLHYFRALIRRRRKQPREDLVTALVRAQEGDERLTDDEILAMVVLLLSAGHETTVNLIGSGVLALLERPDALVKLRADPELVGSAVEELLRFVSPAETATERYASEDVTIADVRIHRGDLVLAVLASANRDASHFDDPDRLDLARTPNRHLAFGQGLHYCLGAALSRLEAQIVIGSLVRRAPKLALAVEPASLMWRRSSIIRGLEALPISLGS